LSEQSTDEQNPAMRFWEERSLDELSDEEWESLCDGCGRCCLQKLEDEQTAEVFFTDVSCRLLDTEKCHCTRYATRFKHVEDCLTVRPLTSQKIGWLPSSCAYRRLAEGRGLADWHPLISGRADSVQEAGIGMGGRCISELEIPVHEMMQHIIVFEDQDSSD